MQLTSILVLIGFATLVYSNSLLQKEQVKADHQQSIATTLFGRSEYKNYPISVMTFKGNLGGHEVQLNGTVQVWKHLKTTPMEHNW